MGEEGGALGARRREGLITSLTFLSVFTHAAWQVAETYTQALSTIASRRATANFHRLYINFAKFYEEGGTTGEAEVDLASARKVLERASKVNFKNVEDLAEIWCEWSEMEVRHE